jgi:hypothetical protein
MDEEAIRDKIRQQLQAGVLPQHLPPAEPTEADQRTSPVPAIRTGRGTGEPCSACEEPIAPGAPLEECAYPSGQVLRFHGLCYKYWNEEREAM